MLHCTALCYVAPCCAGLCWVGLGCAAATQASGSANARRCARRVRRSGLARALVKRRSAGGGAAPQLSPRAR
eukprot:335867-Chlamydomonas_euryale.AAC.1